MSVFYHTTSHSKTVPNWGILLSVRVRSLLFILAFGVVAYHNSFLGPFFFDDKYAILEDPAIRHLWPLPGSWTDIRPVVTLSLALNFRLGGLNVLGYHAFNLAVHLLAALTLFGIVRRTLQMNTLRTCFGSSAPELAAVISILWLVHPLQTQSVNYIIQRAEVLMGLFYLLTLYCLIRCDGDPRPKEWKAAGILCCALGMGSKSIMVTAPLLALLYDRIFLSPSFRETLRRRAWLYAGLAATWGIQGFFLWKLNDRPSLSVGFHLPQVSWIEYLRTQPGVLLHYLKLSFWPEPLVFDYHWPVAKTLSAVLLPAIPIAGLGLVTLWACRRRWRVGFLGAWFFLILAPTSSFIPVADIAVEHRMYLPLAAVAAFAVLGGYRIGIKGPLAAALAGACAVTLTSLTVLRNEDYRNEATVWSDSLKKRPGNARAHNNLGIALSAQGKLDEAIAHFTESFRLEPQYADAYYNCGVAHARMKQYKQAIPFYAKAVELKPNYPGAFDALGHALANLGDLEQAVLLYIQALRLKPNFPLARHHLEKAAGLLAEELKRNPKSAPGHDSLGVALAGQGKLEEAALHFREALRLEPNDSKVHNNWGTALADQGKLEEAVFHFKEALRLDPKNAQARDNLALAYQKQRGGP